MIPAATKPDADVPLGEFPPLTRSILSLIIVLHFCCVFTVLASNLRRSALQNRLVSIFAAYTQLLNFDPDYSPYYHTLAREQDDDAILIVDLYPDATSPIAGQTILKTIELPDGGSRWGESRRRYLALAKIIQANAPQEGEAEPAQDATAGEIAKAIGRGLILQHKAGRAVVRCVRRMSQPMDLTALDPGFPPNSPTDARYDITVYTADVFIDEEGETIVVKRASRNELAPRQNNP